MEGVEDEVNGFVELLKNVGIVAILGGGAYLIYKLWNSELGKTLRGLTTFVTEFFSDPGLAGAHLGESMIDIWEGFSDTFGSGTKETDGPFRPEMNEDKVLAKMTSDDLSLVEFINCGLPGGANNPLATPRLGMLELNWLNPNSNPWTWYPDLGAPPIQAIYIVVTNNSGGIWTVSGNSQEHWTDTQNKWNVMMKAANDQRVRHMITSSAEWQYMIKH